MKIKIDSSPAYNAFLCIVTKQDGGKTKANFDKLLASREKTGENTFDFDLKINGIPFDFEELFKAMDKEWDYEIKRSAKLLVSDKIDSINEATQSLKETLNRVEDKIREDFGLEKWD